MFSKIVKVLLSLVVFGSAAGGIGYGIVGLPKGQASKLKDFTGETVKEDKSTTLLEVVWSYKSEKKDSNKLEKRCFLLKRGQNVSIPKFEEESSDQKSSCDIDLNDTPWMKDKKTKHQEGLWIKGHSELVEEFSNALKKFQSTKNETQSPHPSVELSNSEEFKCTLSKSDKNYWVEISCGEEENN